MDPIAFLGFSEAELRAAVEEAAMAQTYVAAHLYTDEAIARAVRCGVRSLEHCNLIEAATARAAAAAGCIACPTLVTYDALAEEGRARPRAGKCCQDRDSAAGGAALARNHARCRSADGLRYGSARGHAPPPVARNSRSAPASSARWRSCVRRTSVAARLLRLEDRLGRIVPGLLADLIVVEGDPLSDATVLSRPEETLRLVMQGGRIVRNRLAA